MYCDVHVLYMYLRGGDRVGGGGEFGPSLPKIHILVNHAIQARVRWLQQTIKIFL